MGAPNPNRPGRKLSAILAALLAVILTRVALKVGLPLEPEDAMVVAGALVALAHSYVQGVAREDAGRHAGAPRVEASTPSP